MGAPRLLMIFRCGWTMLSVAESVARLCPVRHVPPFVQPTRPLKPVHVDRQPWARLGSQTSPAAGFTTPSPHDTAVQSASQLALAPAVSHTSPRVTLRMPSPQRATLQLALHAVLSW